MAGVQARRVHSGDVTGMQAAMVASINELIKTQVASLFHYAMSEDILTFADLSGTGAANTALAVAAANELMVKYLAHIADTVAHKVAGTPPSLTLATDLTSACTLVEAIRTDYTSHIGSTTYHSAADSTNTIAAAAATTLSTLQGALNELKNTTGFNQHVASAPAAGALHIVPL